MSEHTPRPWEIRQVRNGHTSIYPSGYSERVADVYCPLDLDGSLQANARLIAAAPDLLEVARIVEEALREGEPINDSKNSAYGDMLRAAIRKATGE